MYKLVAVGGTLRGKEYILNEGFNNIGRGSECEVQIENDGISKNHLKISVNGDTCFAEDLGSSNGTIINGQIIKKKTLVNGDKIALPGVIFQLVYVREKKVFIERKVGAAADDYSEDLVEAMPRDLVGKCLYLYKNKILAPIYKLNHEYEWHVMIGIFLSLFVAIVIGVTIVPVLKAHKKVLFVEVSRRAAHYAEEIGRLNASALEQKDLDRVDTNFLNTEQGVYSYELFDPDGRIVRPVKKMNEYTNDTFSIRAREWAVSNSKSTALVRELSDGQIGISKRIKAYNPNLGYEDLVGVIAIRFKPDSWVNAASSNNIFYLQALIFSLALAALLLGMIYYMTLRPIKELERQIESAIRGKRKSLESKYLFFPLDSIRESINNLIQKVRDLEGNDDDNDFGEIEDDTPYVEKIIEFLAGCPGAGLVLDSEKRIKKMNSQIEDLTGIRETASLGENILDVSKEKGFAATIIELCDNSANDDGRSQRGSYEIQGYDYEIFAASLIGKDNFAKGFLVTFMRED